MPETNEIATLRSIEKSGLPVVELPVFYASDRKAITSNKDDCGKILAPLELGNATVRVPAEQGWLTAQKQLASRYEILGWRLNDKESTIKPYIEIRGYVAEADTKAVIKDVHKDNNFWTDLRNEVKQDKDHRVFVYIHGFASSGENAVYASGILSSQVEAPVVSFTWPSAGKVGAKTLGLTTKTLFENDKKIIDSPQVMDDLSKFISQLKREMPADARIELVAHSLGNRLMTRYLGSKARETFDAVYFLAPDVDKRLFLSAVDQISKKAKHVEVYMNPHDKVLGASGLNNLLSFHSIKKLGRSKINVPGIDFIDYASVARPRGIGHYIPFDQLGSMIKTNSPSDDQSQHYFLSRHIKIESQIKTAAKKNHDGRTL